MMPQQQLSDKSTILIVDDNSTNLGVLFDYLRDSGFRVLVAEDGDSALKRLNYVKPDIILLDVIMPGINGFETCARLKANQDTKDIPVIFMTALDDTVDKVKGFELGAVDYITKPLHYEEVLARINTHLTIRNLQRSLQTQIYERDQLIAELDTFAHTVAHDLKNPLGLISGYLSILQEEWKSLSDDQLEEAMEAMARTSHKMNNIIEELLLLASVRKDKVTLTPLDMKQIIREVQRDLAYMIQEYEAELVLPSTWPTALGYPAWVEEVWVNYLSNGLKYGGQPPRLELGSTLQPNAMIRFWVQDNGPGLAVEDQTRLFTPFTRLNEIRVEGYGLGLSIVQRIVTKLGGTVGVESQPGQGSRFYFILPAANKQGV